MKKTDGIGSLLKKKRKNALIDLEVIAKKTKININVLKYLEHEEFESLPNITYVRGFVKTYARLLDISQDLALEQLEMSYNKYQEEIQKTFEEEKLENGDHSEYEKEMSQEQIELQDKVISFIHSLVDRRKISAFIGIIITVVLFKSLYTFFSKVSNEKVKLKPKVFEQKELKGTIPSTNKVAQTSSSKEETKEEQQLQKVSQTNDVKDSVSPQEETKTADSAQTDPSEDDQDQLTDDQENKKPEIKLPPGKVPYREFRPAPLVTFSIIKDAPENKDTKLLPAQFRDKVDSNKENVFIHAVQGDTWLSYKADDDDIKRFVLKKGKFLFISANKIRLFMGNVNSTKIFYNNQLIDPNSKTGVKSLIFPADFAKELLIPLFPTYQGVSYTSKAYIEKMNKKETAN